MKPLPLIQNPAPAAPATDLGPLETSSMVPDQERLDALKPRIVEALATVFDPEIPVNIFELGLIYDIIVDRASRVGIRMTLTAPACPAAQFLPGEVHDKIAQIPGVAGVAVDVVWDPPWDRGRMSEAAQLQLGLL